MTCTAASCNPTVFSANQSGLNPIAADGTNVYWTTGVGATLLSCAVGAGCAAPTTLATGQNVGGIAVDATSVYWTNSGFGTVVRLAK